MIRVLAIDDEMLALELLEDNIRKVPFLELVKGCRSGFEAMDLLSREKIDLIFLDIQMPDITGIQLLKGLSVKPLVIFTTAYEKYAVEGFELDVIDYLLKPFSFERFLKAVNKAREYIELRERQIPSGSPSESDTTSSYLFVKSDYKLIKVTIKDILFIEGLKDYIKIYPGEKPVITLLSMKSIEEKLPASDFTRVHRSYIVNLRKISFIQKSTIFIGSHEIPIGENYRDAFFAIVNKNKTAD
ncbi:MAG: LytR/AlgR family response regulator transcription factor [Syntrophothermus sp.]